MTIKTRNDKSASKPEQFCAAPFSQLVLKPDGSVSPCCYLYHVKLGNLKEKSLMDIWNDKPIEKMRREFLHSSPKACRSKIKYLGCNRFFQSLEGELSKEAIQKKPPVKLDVRLNGQCNLSCVMCDVWEQPNGVYKQTSFWDEGPIKIFPFLKEIEVLGGEPFIQKDTYRLIDAVSAVNPQCFWSFVTNAHYPFTKKLEHTLSNINLKQIQISLDSLDPSSYQHIRKGGDLKRTLKTIDQFTAFRSKYETTCSISFRFIISMCVLKSNRHEIPEFLKFCEEKGAEPQFQFAFYDPSGQESLSYLRQDEKIEYLAFLKERITEQDWPLIASFIAPLIDELKNKKNANL